MVTVIDNRRSKNLSFSKIHISASFSFFLTPVFGAAYEKIPDLEQQW